MKKNIAEIKFLRSIMFPILSKLNFKYQWKHDVTKRKFYLFTWLHKGYWFYGSKRESSELKMFSKLIDKGDHVFEIGGHIGYVTQVFEDLVGLEGKVLVAEPTIQSRYLLEKNVRDGTKVLPYAVADIDGKMDFYTEAFGGFTNSLVSEFTEGSNEWLSNSQKTNKGSVSRVNVEVKTVDRICEQYLPKPSFLKIDVEGAELLVLKGAKKTLKNVKALMVEVSRDHKEIFSLLDAYGFIAIDAQGNPCEENIRGENKNIFFVKKS